MFIGEIMVIVGYSDDVVLFDSLDGNGDCSRVFYGIFQFSAKVKLAALDGNPASVSDRV